MHADEERIRNIHRHLRIDFGSFEEELPEQIMSAKFLKGTEKVLEIGGNIGRNSLVISYILSQKNNNDFVCIETDLENADKLKHNRNMNNLKFHIETSALSSRKLIQKGWNTRPLSDHESIPYDHHIIDTITWKELNRKYNIMFDTLVLDCEGAFYYILLDTPEILDNINLIIVENDYCDTKKQEYVENKFIENGFTIAYAAPHPWAKEDKNFYQVWKKK
jgi:FkbM family methyltransferase